MRIEAGVIAALAAQSPTLVGSRIYAERLPQEVTYPAITLSRASTSQGVLLAGVDTLTEVRLQLDIWAQDATHKTIADSVRTLLNGYQGALGGVIIQYCKFDGENDASSFDGDWEVNRVSMDFTFTLHE